MGPKYPRTPHLPWSPGLLASKQSDDKVLADVTPLLRRELMITEKIDGGNVRMTSQELTARSQNGAPSHPSYDWIKAKWGSEWRWLIPDHLSIFVEYAMAVHSIAYENLPSPAMLIGVRSDHLGFWAMWEHVEYWSQQLGIPTVPVVNYSFVPYDEKELRKFTNREGSAPGFYGTREGVVVRPVHAFDVEDFGTSVAKWVREGHVQTDQHWAHGAWTKNNIKRQ